MVEFDARQSRHKPPFQRAKRGPITNSAESVQCSPMSFRNPSAAVALVALASVPLLGQDRLKTMAGYERAQRLARESPTGIRDGNIGVTWLDDTAFEYSRDGKR